MISLNDNQLEILTVAVNALPQEKRAVFIARVEGYLRMKIGQSTDRDIKFAIELARRGLVHVAGWIA